MKKTFPLTHPKTKPARLIDSVRRDVKRYIKRERNKELPEGVDFWDFDCKFGPTADDAETVHVAELAKRIDAVEAENLTSIYIEIIAKPANRSGISRPTSEDSE